MKVRKFKIKIQSSHEAPGESFDKSFKEAWKLAERRQLNSLEHDLVLTFPDVSWLSKIFSPERIRLIQAVREKKPESIYRLAKILERVPANVQRDVHELAEFGIIELKRVRKKGQKRELLQPEYNWDGFDIAV